MPALSSPPISSSATSPATQSSTINSPSTALAASLTPNFIAKPKKVSSSSSSTTGKTASQIKKNRVDQNVGVNRVVLEYDNGFFTPTDQVLKPQFSIYFHNPSTVIVHNILMIIFVGPQKQRRKGSKSFSGTLPSWLSEPKLSFAPLNYAQKKEIEKEKVSLQPQNKETHTEQPVVVVTNIEGMNPIKYAMNNQKMRFDIKEIDKLKWTSTDMYSVCIKDLKINPKIKVPENYSGGNGLSNFSGYITLVFFFEQQDPTNGTISLREQELTFKMATRRNRGDPNVDPKDAEFKYYMCYTSGNYQKELLANTEYENVFDEKLVFEKKVKYPKCTEKERMKRLLDIKYNFLTQDLFQQQLKAKRIRDSMYGRGHAASSSSSVTAPRSSLLSSPTMLQPRSVPAQPPAVQFPADENPTITTETRGNEPNSEYDSNVDSITNTEAFQSSSSSNSLSGPVNGLGVAANQNTNSGPNQAPNQNSGGVSNEETQIFKSTTFPASLNVVQEIQFLLSHYYHNPTALTDGTISLLDLQSIFQQILYIISTYNSQLDPLPAHDQNKIAKVQRMVQPQTNSKLSKQPPVLQELLDTLNEIQALIYAPNPTPELDSSSASSTSSKSSGPKSKSKPKSASSTSSAGSSTPGSFQPSPMMPAQPMSAPLNGNYMPHGMMPPHYMPMPMGMPPMPMSMPMSMAMGMPPMHPMSMPMSLPQHPQQGGWGMQNSYGTAQAQTTTTLPPPQESALSLEPSDEDDGYQNGYVETNNNNEFQQQNNNYYPYGGAYNQEPLRPFPEMKVEPSSTATGFSGSQNPFSSSFDATPTSQLSNNTNTAAAHPPHPSPMMNPTPFVQKPVAQFNSSLLMSNNTTTGYGGIQNSQFSAASPFSRSQTNPNNTPTAQTSIVKQEPLSTNPNSSNNNIPAVPVPAIVKQEPQHPSNPSPNVQQSYPMFAPPQAMYPPMYAPMYAAPQQQQIPRPQQQQQQAPQPSQQQLYPQMYPPAPYNAGYPQPGAQMYVPPQQQLQQRSPAAQQQQQQQPLHQQQPQEYKPYQYPPQYAPYYNYYNPYQQQRWNPQPQQGYLGPQPTGYPAQQPQQQQQQQQTFESAMPGDGVMN